MTWKKILAPLRVVASFAVLASFAAPATAQTTPVPQQNILKWPLPDTLSPEGRVVATAMANAPVPNPMPTVAVQRQILDSMQSAMSVPLAKRYAVHVESTVIAGVPVRVAYPAGVTALGSGAVLLNLHGGGFQLDSGSLTESIPIAGLTGIPVVSVLYRMAPEYPFPAALDDALAVYQALEKERPARRIAVFGTSAGAVLSGELIAKLTKMRRPMPAALGFFSGSADISKHGDSESWAPLPTGETTLAGSISSYVGTTDPADPILSPLHGDISRFPPTLLVSSTRDVLLSDTAIFGRALIEKGVDARLVVFDGLPHAFWAYMDIPESTQAETLMANFLKKRVDAQ